MTIREENLCRKVRKTKDQNPQVGQKTNLQNKYISIQHGMKLRKLIFTCLLFFLSASTANADIFTAVQLL
jgi:hypothetical protein